MNMQKIFRPTRLALALATVLALSACAGHIEATRPDVALPQTWMEASSGNAALQRDWWRGFQSEELSALIEDAQATNPTLLIAAERVTQAEITARSAGASLFPLLTVSADTGTGRVKSGTATVGGWAKSESSGASLQVNYEVDVWGRVAATAASANASLDATRFDLETARTTLTTGVANAYFQTLALRTRLKIAEQNLAIAEKLFAIVEARYRYGSASALDVSRQRSTVLAQRATILPLQTQERQTVTALAILLGRPPQSLQVAAQGIEGLAVPEVAPNLPSTLITRRPDIASAEATLYAADANVAAARAALLPTISLSGAAGASSSALLNLGSPTYSIGIAASIVQTLFDGNRLRLQVESSESSRRQLVESYRSTIYTALKEVEDALGNTTRNREQERSQTEIRAEAQRALRLSELRYREGADDLNSLLDAQRTLFSAEDSLAQQRLSRLTGTTDLFKALGGGWERPPASAE
ncbi:RND transporter [Oxalicibacterium flavum]|uniref:RND transporter n=1 Tax=Oxalicibacterium flavum TaxID=179467 RepID=A0A8J2UPT8_9BURK|nr:efflux transporter outer membrane subunit [Oxalicibacterium flavum]GGC10662.1 RND transporter [Oxalicibacterium flavum]